MQNKIFPGISDFTYDVLKNQSISYISKLTLLLKNNFKFNYFILENCNYNYHPQNFKTFPYNVSNCRPNFFHKLSKVLIFSQVDPFIDKNGTTQPEQFGFRTDFSASHQVYRLVKHITVGKIWKQIHYYSFSRYSERIRHSFNFWLWQKINFISLVIKSTLSYHIDEIAMSKVRISFYDIFCFIRCSLRVKK